MKRQYTKTVFIIQKGQNTGIEVRLIKNKKEGRSFDVIQFKIYTTKDQEDVCFNASPEEALEMAWGLIKAVRYFLNGFEPYHRFRESKNTKFDKKDIWWSL